MAVELVVAKAMEALVKKEMLSEAYLDNILEKNSLNEGSIKDIKSLAPDIETIKANSIQQILEENKDKIMDVRKAIFQEERIEISGFKVQESISQNTEKKGLSTLENAKVKELTGWSDEIVNSIGSIEEFEIYKKAGLVEGEINAKECLMKTDIDWSQKDQFGSTNAERVAEGYAPLDKNGKPIQLHHIGQHVDSPLAELTFEEHRTGGNDTILHDKNKETEVHGEGNNWDHERKEYWRNRLE